MSIFFGGIGKCNWAFKEVYSLDTKTWKWTEHSGRVTGEAPCVRVGQTVTLLPDGKRVLVHGGHDPRSPADCYDDAYVLDTATWRWVGVESRPDQRPSRRAGHCGVMVGGTHFVTFGGQLNNGDKAKDVWQIDTQVI